MSRVKSRKLNEEIKAVEDIYEEEGSEGDEEEEEEDEDEDEEGDDDSEDGPEEDLVDDNTYDVFNLTNCNYHTIRFDGKLDKEATLLKHAQRTTQWLMKKYV